MSDIADPTLQGVLARARPDMFTLVNHLGAMALIRAGATITQHRFDAGTGLHEYHLSLENGRLKFKYDGVRPLLTEKQITEMSETLAAWHPTLSFGERWEFKKLLHGGDDRATAEYLHEQTRLPVEELIVFIANAWERNIARLFAIDGPD